MNKLRKRKNAIPAKLTQNNEIALFLWTRMGKQINWDELPILVEYYDEIEDVELLIQSLLQIRNGGQI